jgi:catechol 2,3-dioxygenase-like lactoylglutathione lyase family enzyme
MYKLSHICLYVFDQDEARDFYTTKLGFEVRQDVTLEGYRWLTVGPPEQPDVEIVLALPEPPALDPDTVDAVRDVLARGAMGGCILHTEDCRAKYEELKARGVEFSVEPNETFYGVDAAFRDPYGNPFRLVQPAAVPAA